MYIANVQFFYKKATWSSSSMSPHPLRDFLFFLNKDSHLIYSTGAVEPCARWVWPNKTDIINLEGTLVQIRYLEIVPWVALSQVWKNLNVPKYRRRMWNSHRL
jgi:hypothetical protein